MDPAIFLSFDRPRSNYLDVAPVLRHMSRRSFPLARASNIIDACVVVILLTEQSLTSRAVAQDIGTAIAKRKGLFGIVLPSVSKLQASKRHSSFAHSTLQIHGHTLLAFHWSLDDGPRNFVSWARSMHPQVEYARLHRRAFDTALIPGTYVM